MKRKLLGKVALFLSKKMALTKGAVAKNSSPVRTSPSNLPDFKVKFGGTTVCTISSGIIISCSWVVSGISTSGSISLKRYASPVIKLIEPCRQSKLCATGVKL